jgi:hypothetical protein
MAIGWIRLARERLLIFLKKETSYSNMIYESECASQVLDQPNAIVILDKRISKANNAATVIPTARRREMQ